MIRLAVVLWVLLAGHLVAAPVLVKTGEHDGFTRLVMEFPTSVEWQMGRSADGYELRVTGQPANYDLSEAFKLIGKSRLAAIWVDAQTAGLRIGIACGCHAMPFEFRPGIVVIDLRDGPPPNGSSFEQPLYPETPDNKAVAEGGYDWQKQALAELRGEGAANTPKDRLASLPSSDPALQSLRESLLHQLGRGASQGIVDIGHPSPPQPLPPQEFASARVSLGELPGVSVTNGLSRHTGLAADGQTCIAGDQLDLTSWGDERPVHHQMAEAMAGLVGEFDQPNAEALRKAIRFHLFIGFGIEARQLMRAFPVADSEAALWTSLARLVDAEPDPSSAFIGQAACDTPAALWALLADPALQAGAKINADAAYLAFSALPIALRRHLGPGLADRFLAVGDRASAAKVRDAILRAPGMAGPRVDLMQAQLDMTNADPAAAESRLNTLVTDSGPETPSALVGLATARVAQALPVTPDLVTALEAVLRERAGTEKEAETRHALLLARAASGDFDTAFESLPDARDAEPQLWHLLSKLGQDDAILRHAVLASDALQPRAPSDTAANLAQRLLDLGLAENALRWLPDASAADPLMLAQIHLQRRDGRSALAALTGLDTQEALALRAQAMQQLGDEAAAARLYAKAGDSTAELNAVHRAQDWADLGQRGAEPWKSAAAALAGPKAPAPDGKAEGPLAQGHELVAAAAETRAAVAALLNSVAAP